MKRYLLGIFILFLICLNVSAAISSENKECLQRGYDIVSGYHLIEMGYENISSNGEIYCLFPDNSYCVLSEFNEGYCGGEFMVEDYCVKQGDFIWEENKCCEELKPYLPPSFSGHASCQPFSVRFIGNLKYEPFYWLLELIILLGIIYGIYRLIKKRRR